MCTYVCTCTHMCTISTFMQCNTYMNIFTSIRRYAYEYTCVQVYICGIRRNYKYKDLYVHVSIYAYINFEYAHMNICIYVNIEILYVQNYMNLNIWHMA